MKKQYRDPVKDYAWFMRHPENIARYAGKVVLLRHHTVLGSGADSVEAYDDARRRAEAENRELPQDDLIYFPVNEPIGFGAEYFGGSPVPQQEG